MIADTRWGKVSRRASARLDDAQSADSPPVLFRALSSHHGLQFKTIVVGTA
jgi:hypothetical protein